VKFEFFDHTADLGGHIFGATPEGLFQNAATSVYHALGTFHLKPERTTLSLTLTANSQEELLVEFLGELLFRFDAHRLLFDQIEILQLKTCSLIAKLTGAEVDLSRSEPNYEIKAVTYHHATVEPHNGHWRATIIFDV